MRTAYSRQQSYANPKRRDVRFEEGDHVFLKISTMKGIQRFGKKGKLAPRYIGPFQIMDRMGKVSYRLALPPQMSQVHPVFHVSLLWRYMTDPTHVLPVQEVDMRADLSYPTYPVAMIDRQIRVLRNKEVNLVKIQWHEQGSEECIWEAEQAMKEEYPQLF